MSDTMTDVLERLRLAIDFDAQQGTDAQWTELLCQAINATAEITRLRDENERLKQALDPSPATKAAYMSEFAVPLPELDDDGNEYIRQINVPWTTIKEIMGAIRNYADNKKGSE